MKTIPLFVTTLAATIAVTACGQMGLGHRPSPDADSRHEPTLLFSPNGEPLTGGKPCGDTMTLWFSRMDAGHSGRLERKDFLADAQTQFKRMDLDHDGFITADELSAFRAPFLRPADDGEAETPPRGEAGSGTDPVMSADGNLDFKVTLAEFLKQAGDVFDHLDSDHDGTLSPLEIRGFCPPAPP